jgi:hypothetical protein
VLCIAFPVDQGHVAQPNAAPDISVAAFAGKPVPSPQPAECSVPRSDRQALLSLVKSFFKDNPDWK